MERLTYRTELGVSIDKNEDCPSCNICWNCNIPPRECKYISDVLEKLADYEDLEEQGRLVKLPCKVGARLYWIDDEDDYGHKEMCIRQYSESEKVTGFSLGEDGEVLVFIGYDNNEPDMVGERYALLTRESAEAKLKELRGNND